MRESCSSNLELGNLSNALTSPTTTPICPVLREALLKACFDENHNPWSFLFGSFVVYRIRGEGGHPFTPKGIPETRVLRLPTLKRTF